MSITYLYMYLEQQQMNKFMNFREEGKVCAIFQREGMEGKMMFRNSKKKDQNL